jgi:hypothetical protein
MDAWSRLEGMMSETTREILGINDQASRAISATVMARQAIDLFEAAGKLHFNDAGVKRISKLAEKLIRRNSRRNSIVHGSWVQVVIVTDGNVGMDADLQPR